MKLSLLQYNLIRLYILNQIILTIAFIVILGYDIVLVYVINKYLKLNKYKTRYKLIKNIVFFPKEIYSFSYL